MVPLITTPAEDLNTAIYDAPSSQVIVVTSPPRSRSGSVANDECNTKESDEENDFANSGQEDTRSALDASSMPVRVIYSPAVSRNISFRRNPHIQTSSLVSDTETDLGNYVAIPSSASAALPPLGAPLSPQRQIHRNSRHNSFTSNIEASPTTIDRRTRSSQSTSNPATARAANDEQEAGYEENDHTTPLFKAFPERRWFRSIVVAKLALGIVTCSVLGNLAYT
jgi:hypothetical protein